MNRNNSLPRINKQLETAGARRPTVATEERCETCQSAGQGKPAKVRLTDRDKQLIAVLAVERIHYVPPALVKAIIHRSSAFNPRAHSIAGAIGLMQVMPFNAARVGLTAADLSDPAKNILAGTRLFAALLRYSNGDLISALVAYNARPRRLFAPIPRNGETARYVSAILRYFGYFSRAQPSFAERPGAPIAATASSGARGRGDSSALVIQ